MKSSAICEKCACEEVFERPLTPEQEKKVRDGGDGRWLCNDCWHSVRETTLPPFYIKRDDGYSPNAFAQTKSEAEAQFAKYYGSWYGPRWSVVPADRWFGDRIAHPGYMAKRRAAVLAEHPEYAR
jgi:hypothetical protein